GRLRRSTRSASGGQALCDGSSQACDRTRCGCRFRCSWHARHRRQAGVQAGDANRSQTRASGCRRFECCCSGRSHAAAQEERLDLQKARHPVELRTGGRSEEKEKTEAKAATNSTGAAQQLSSSAAFFSVVALPHSSFAFFSFSFSFAFFSFLYSLAAA